MILPPFTWHILIFNDFLKNNLTFWPTNFDLGVKGHLFVFSIFYNVSMQVKYLGQLLLARYRILMILNN